MSIRYLSLSLRSSIKGEDRFKEGISQDNQDRRDSQDFSIFVPLSCSVLYLLLVFSLSFMSPSPSSSQSSCLTAVSNSVESYHSQVLHLLSASVVTFTSRMAAAPQPVNEAAAQVARSIQSMTAAHVMNEELNNNAQAPVVRHALSQVEPTQKDQGLQRIMESVTVNTQPNRAEHLLKCLIKSQMADHPQQWDDHCGDIRYFISSFNREEKQHKHKLFGPDFPRTFLTLTPGCPGVKNFFPTTGPQENALFGADAHDFRRGRP